jgi:hypothetical protein
MLLAVFMGVRVMSAATASFPGQVPATREARSTTLLDLVRSIGEVTDDEREVIATVLHMLSTGEVRLCGNFRNAPIEDLE